MQTTMARRSILCAAALALVAAAPSWSQTMIRTITRHRVEPAHVADFQAAVKDYNEVLKKAGWTQARTLWRSASGPGEFALTLYYRSYADLDKVTAEDPKLKPYGRELAAISARINSFSQSYERIIDEIMPDLSVLSNDPAPMVRVLRTVAKPERLTEFTELLRNELLPAMNQAGVKLYMVSRTRLGGPSTEFRSMIGFENWAGLPAAMSAAQNGMKPDKYAAFTQKYRLMIVESQYDVYRYQPELSYIPARNNTTK